MNNSLYEIKKLQSQVRGGFKLNINKFEIHRGAIYLFSGRIESGKSLMLNILSQNSKYSGEIRYEGESLDSYKGYQKEVAFVSAPPSGFKTGEQFIQSYINKYDAIKKKNKDYKNIVRITGANAFLNKRLYSLSANRRRMVSLIAGVLADPKVLIIDDLDSYLTTEELKVFKKIISRKASYDGVTVIASCRYTYNFPKFASVNITLDSGRIVKVRS